MPRLPKAVVQEANFTKCAHLKLFSNADDLMVEIQQSGNDFPSIMKLFREFGVDQPSSPMDTSSSDSEPSSPVPPKTRKSRKPKMNEVDKRIKKREAVRKHRKNIKDTIENSENEIKRLTKLSNDLDSQMKNLNSMVNQIKQMTAAVFERMEKKMVQNDHRLVPQIRQSGCG